MPASSRWRVIIPMSMQPLPAEGHYSGATDFARTGLMPPEAMHNADLLFRRVLPTGLTPDMLQQLLCQRGYDEPEILLP
jgi:hypothetical protein